MKNHALEAAGQALLMVVIFVFSLVVLMSILDPETMTNVGRALGFIADHSSNPYLYTSKVKPNLDVIYLLLIGMWAFFWLIRWWALEQKDRNAIDAELRDKINRFMENN